MVATNQIFTDILRIFHTISAHLMQASSRFQPGYWRQPGVFSTGQQGRNADFLIAALILSQCPAFPLASGRRQRRYDARAIGLEPSVWTM
ncbi:MAG TPA: hypothetical protein VFQ80_13780 [Thermomicrobiales bacterium]|jgi:hypothetical protein|nr:hypothetical protein [Thermomicrobiales bacterium]